MLYEILFTLVVLQVRYITCPLPAWYQKEYHKEAEKIYKDYKVVPDIIEKAPRQVANVTFHTGDQNITVKPGDELSLDVVNSNPTVRYLSPGLKKNTVFMIDLDVPNNGNPEDSPWVNWFMVNVPHTSLPFGHTRFEYRPPRPDKDSGVHRIVILVYRQASVNELKFNFPPDAGPHKFNIPYVNYTQTEERKRFDLDEFLDFFYYDGLLAANFFRVRWCENIPDIHNRTDNIVDTLY